MHQAPLAYRLPEHDDEPMAPAAPQVDPRELATEAAAGVARDLADAAPWRQPSQVDARPWHELPIAPPLPELPDLYRARSAEQAPALEQPVPSPDHAAAAAAPAPHAYVRAQVAMEAAPVAAPHVTSRRLAPPVDHAPAAPIAAATQALAPEP